MLEHQEPERTMWVNIWFNKTNSHPWEIYRQNKWVMAETKPWHDLKLKLLKVKVFPWFTPSGKVPFYVDSYLEQHQESGMKSNCLRQSFYCGNKTPWPKAIGGGKCLFHIIDCGPKSREIRAKTWRLEPMQRLWRSATYWLAPPSLLTGTTHNELGLSTSIIN